MGGKKQRCEESAGVRGCLREYIKRHMLDAVDASFKILICDERAAAVLNSCMRVHELMRHGVTLLEDLATPRQPIINSPALYFFAPSDNSVGHVIADWSVAKPYKEAHIFALGTTPRACIQQLAQARIVSEVLSFKDLFVDFIAPEPLVFHLNMQKDASCFLSTRPSPCEEAALDVATTRLASVFSTLNDGAPLIHYQNRSRICENFAAKFFDKVTKLCSCDAQGFTEAVGGRDKPLLIILDRGFDMVTPLVHHRSYQCLLNDLLSLEDNIYKQTYTNRMGEVTEKEHFLDEEDEYWSLYRHRFFAYCLKEFPTALQKLYAENPGLAQGKRVGKSVAELGSAVRALPWFQEQEAKLSLHIDICTNIMDIYRAQSLADVCEVEQDIAAARKSHKENLDNVRRLLKRQDIPRRVRLRLLLLLFAASDIGESMEAKLLSVVEESELVDDARVFAGLKDIMCSFKKNAHCNVMLERRRDGNSFFPGDSANGDPFVNQMTMLIESIVKNTLNTTEFPLMASSSSSPLYAAAGATNRHVNDGAGTPKKSLRVGLSLATLQTQREEFHNKEMSAQSFGSPLVNFSALDNRKRSDAAFLDLGDGDGKIVLKSSQRIVLFVIGGLTCSEMCVAYETSKRFGREVIVGGTSILRPDEFIEELEKLSLS